MSLLSELRGLESEIADLQNRREKLLQSDQLKQELEFEEKLKGLMAEYSKSLKDIVAVIDKGQSAPVAKRQNRERSVKTFKNPNTGEIVQTKGGNHKVLKEWRNKWGAEAVASWLV